MAATELIALRIPSDMHAQLSSIAQQEGVTMASIVRRMLHEQMGPTLILSNDRLRLIGAARVEAESLFGRLHEGIRRVDTSPTPKENPQLAIDAYEKIERMVADKRDVLRAGVGQAKYRKLLDLVRRRADVLHNAARSTGSPLVSTILRERNGRRVEVAPSGPSGVNAIPRREQRA